MTKDIIIIDTNCARDVDTKNFFGNRKELEKFTIDCSILVPDMVINEILEQKRRAAKKCFDDLRKNKQFERLNTELPEDIDDYIEKQIQKCLAEEEISYSTISLRNKESALDKIEQLALKKLPPFESIDGSDKGFKDAVICMEIEQCIEDNSESAIFVLTNDPKISEYCDGTVAQVVKNHGEYINLAKHSKNDAENLIRSLTDENSAVEFSEPYRNINNNWAVESSFNESLTRFLLDFDTNEVQKGTDFTDFSVDIVLESENFATTHTVVAKLSDLLSYLKDDELCNIIQFALVNNQVYSISHDWDIRTFLEKVYSKVKHCLTRDVLDDFKEKILDKWYSDF